MVSPAQERSTSNSGANAHSQTARETHVTAAEALNVGYTFMRTGNGTRGNGMSKQAMQLVYTGQAFDSLTNVTTDCYYVFALQPKGFVIVAADNRVEPILGYSYDNNFEVEHMPDHVRGWLGNYEKQIEAVVKQDIAPEAQTTTKWSRLKAGQSVSTRSGETVGPLLTTQWGQTGVYGLMCPNGIVGCVGVAVAQIMNYWQYPEKGIGHIDFAGHEATFNDTYYRWDSLSSIPDALPTLMYHAAMGSSSLFMSGSTGSTLWDASHGLNTFFDYFVDPEIKDYYPIDQWISMIKDNLNYGMPLLYDGGAHAWVCDGYDEDDLFHMNWGWDGSFDGYYALDNLYVGLSDFNGYSVAVFGIHPAYSSLQTSFDYSVEDTNSKLIYFYDFSKNNPDNYLWDFGDGSISTQINPSHLYDFAGLFEVSLTVEKDGVSESYSQTIKVNDYLFFKEVPTNLKNLKGSGIALDYNMDGLQDLFWFDDENGKFSVYKNCDSLSSVGYSFEHVADFTKCYATSNFNEMAQVVDFNNKNMPSVLYYRYALSPYLGTYWYLIGNNNGNMERDESYIPSFFHHCFAGRAEISLQKEFGMFEVLDYDNDGLMDLAAGDTLFKNIGNGLFCPIDTILSHGVGTWIDVDGDGDFDVFPRAWMDIDKDGDVDIFSTDGVYINNGAGCFQYFQIPSGIADDFDGDGQIEILRHNTFYKGDFVSLVFDSLIVETEEDDIDMNLSNARYRIPADFNNDGIVDIIASDVFTEISAVYNYHEDTVARYELNFDLDVRTPTWIDYDNNGSIDIIRPYQVLCDSRTHLFKNTMNNNLPPTAPTNLSVETSGNTAILHWNTSTDDHTHSGALTYNIAVGSAPDSCDIYSPLSNLETGKRYAVNKGNAGMGTTWRINDLPNGTYYWRVQAIDQAFAASPFSEMGVFTILGNNIPPAMAPITMNCYLNDSVLFSKSEFISHYSDRDKDTMQSLIITSLPVYGKLYLYGNTVTENQIISINDIDSLCLITTHFGDDIMRLKPFDGHDWSNLETPVRIHTSIFRRDRTFPDISGDVAWGDFDNDGKMDFASTSGIYHNTGSDFERLSDSVPRAEHVVWADVDDDGLIDCIFDGHVLINTGTGHFTLDVSLAEWTETGVAVGDINNDNRVDYIISGGDIQNEPQTRLFYNQGGGFTGDSSSNILQGYRTGDISIGDYNNDGRQDIVLDGIYDGNSRQTSIYRNDKTTLAAISHDIPGINVGSVSWGDFDLDGDLDLLVCGSKGTTDNTITAIYENYGGNVFIEHVRSTFASSFRGEAVWYDYDNDGYLDVLVSGINSGTKLYRNLYGEQFELVSHTGLPDLTFTSVDVVDYDGDGYEDIILSGVNDENLPYISVYHNGFGVNAIAQSVPSNLLAEVSGSSVIMSWNDTTSSTYNIYVCDSQGFYISPLADTVTGFRKVTDNGNVGYSKNYTLRGLPAGSYYWGVQAIDKSHKGGVFAKGQAFTIECSNQDTTIVYDTTCKYRQDGVYYEYYLNNNGCDSVVERHVTVREDCKDVFYVRQDGSPDNSGYSWERAISDLQVAINLAAEVNGQVWVAQGIYYGDSISENAFTIPGGVQVYGGFEGNEPVGYDLSLRDFTAHPTILDGQYSQRTVYHSWYGGEMSLLDGFIIQNGFTTNEGGNVMGGYPKLQVSNCIIRNGAASEDAGGAAYAIVTNSVIYNNIGHNWAGGISNCSATNCVLVNNNASVSAAVSSTMTNCILWNNGGWDQALSNTFTYSAVQGWVGGGEWNIALSLNNDGFSPDSNYVRFVDPENGDFRLSYGSACINAGTPDISELGLPSVDLQGLPRVLDGRIDMGAYEYYPVTLVEMYDSLCEGNSIVFFDSLCSDAGRYLHHTNVEDVASDTLYVLHLQVYPTYLTDSIIQLSGNGYVRDGQTYIQPGIYSFLYSTVHGCDSLIRITLYDSAITVCDNHFPFIIGDTTFDNETVSGLYPVTSNGQELLVYLQVNPTHKVYDTIAACETQWVYVGDVCFRDSLPGDYQVFLQSSCGCDSLIYLHYTVNPSYWFDLYDTIPRGTEYSANGFYISTEETQNVRQTKRYFWYWASTGCDSTYVLHLTLTGTPIRYVTQDGTGDGSSWVNAMGDLQAAMDSAALEQGDVWVAQGTYYGDGISENAFMIPDGVHVYGGFAGNEPADYDLSLRNFTAHPTVLDGQYVQRTVYHDWTWDLTPVLDGFTIQNGHSSLGGNVFGGEPMLQVTNCTIRGGVSEGDAGGLYYTSVRNSVIVNNTSSYWGSAMYECDAYNCIIMGNNATEYGYTAQWSTLTNCILWKNVGYPEYGCTIKYSAVEDQEVWGEGNIFLAHNNDGISPDSNYVRFMDSENGDFRLSYGSACINAGTPDISELGLPSVDLQGLPRVLDGRIDMGAYEFYPIPEVVTYDTICKGGSIVFFDSICTAAGSYVHHTHAEDVTLDTLHVLHLTLYPTPTVTISGNQNVCETEPVSLTASVEADGFVPENLHFTWYESGQIRDNMAYGYGDDSVYVEYMYPSNEPYHYSVEVTFGADFPCASQSGEYLVYVHSQPVVQVIATETSICVGGNTTVMAVLNDYNDSNVSYSWSNGHIGQSYTFTPASSGAYTFTVTATNLISGCTSIDEFTIDVNDMPETPVVTVDHPMIFDGGQVTLSVTNAMEGAIYTWYRNGFLIEGEVQATLVDYPLSVGGETTTYNYNVVAALYNSGCVSSISANTDVTVAPSPVAVVSVEGNTVLCEGNSTTLHVNVMPAEIPYTYQWYKDNVLIPDATSTDYVVTESARAIPYSFRVFVSANGINIVNANAPDITVVPQPVVVATISNENACVGGTTTLTATVSGAIPGTNGYYYEWYRTNSDNPNPEFIASSDVYTSSGTEPEGSYHYWVTVSSSYGCYAQSELVNFNVVGVPTVTISRMATYNATVYEGSSTAIIANVTGGYGETSYQWYKNGLILLGETYPVLYIDALSYGANDIYAVEVSQTGVGCTTTADAAINTLVTVVPIYTVDIAGAGNVCEGGTVTLTATVNNAAGGDVLSYQWYRVIDSVSVPIDGATSVIYSTSDLIPSDSYNYFVVVTGVLPGSMAVSNIVSVNVMPTPAVIIQGTDNINYGQSTTLTASGADFYEWSTGDSIASISVCPTTVTSYTVTGTSLYGCTGTSSVTVTVNNVIPTVITDNVTNVTTSTAVCGGNITSHGGAEVTGRGVCWSMLQNPTISDAHTTDGVGTGSFVSSITGLAPNTTYYVRAYATNSVGTAYGEESVFTTSCETAVSEFSITTCDSYVWNDSTYTESGDYLQTFTNSAGCDSVVTLHLTIYESTTSEFSIITEDSCYTWNDIDYCESGDYTQTFQTIHGCDSVVTLHLTITVGVDDHETVDFKVFPNPTNGVLNVECRMKNEEWGEVEIHVVDMYGKLIQTVETMCTSSLQRTIDISDLASGVYFVKLMAEDKTVAVKKVVKK